MCLAVMGCAPDIIVACADDCLVPHRVGKTGMSGKSPLLLSVVSQNRQQQQRLLERLKYWLVVTAAVRAAVSLGAGNDGSHGGCATGTGGSYPLRNPPFLLFFKFFQGT